MRLRDMITTFKELTNIDIVDDINKVYSTNRPGNAIFIEDIKNKKKGRETPEEFLKHNKIKDKVVAREFKKIFKTRGKGRSYTSILKEAVEVASYYE